MPVQEVQRLKEALSQLLGRLDGMEREEVLVLLTVVENYRAKVVFGRAVRSVLGWVGLVGTTVATLIGVVAALRSGGFL